MLSLSVCLSLCVFVNLSIHPLSMCLPVLFLSAFIIIFVISSLFDTHTDFRLVPWTVTDCWP